MAHFNAVCITTHPSIIQGTLSDGVIGRARDTELLSLEFVNPRDFAKGLHQAVDDKVYGGGDGMLMTAEMALNALVHSQAIVGKSARVVRFTPKGRVWSQKVAKEWAYEHSDQKRGLILLCSRYAGIDERITKLFEIEDVSIGEYVLSGGELPAAVLLDSVVRLLPGALGNSESALQDSFSFQLVSLLGDHWKDVTLVEGVQFTRPREFRSEIVPDVLLCGDPNRVRRFQALSSINETIVFLKSNRKTTELIELKQAISRSSGPLRKWLDDLDLVSLSWLSSLSKVLSVK